ncbi:hypothetical protein O3P69_016295 [Scylla paramamosain]|uniref:Mutator-like transposase domain-containing protein n=1 Tax=Scylla paramamosain TaxID=85552 RepID=A0AAW0SB10_SCYPA
MGESQPGPSLVKRKKVDTSNTTDEPQLKEDMPPALLKRKSTTVSSVRFGAVRRIHSQCEVCGEEEQQYTSNRVAPRGKFDANVKLVEFALSNNGFKTIEDMEETFENKFMSSASFHKIAKTVETEGITKSEEALSDACKLVHKFIESQEPGAPTVKDISVTCDATWSKRGFVAKYGVVPVIHLETGLVLDYELLSKYCHYCEIHQNDEGDWYSDHEQHCQKNYEGSSPAMEVEGWKRLWMRSIEKCKFRYTTVISDGDSKAYTAIVNEKIYGEDIEVKKEECINHVAKRVGKALRDFVQQKSRKAPLCLNLVALMPQNAHPFYRSIIDAQAGDVNSTQDDGEHDNLDELLESRIVKALRGGGGGGSHEQNTSEPLSQLPTRENLNKLHKADLQKRCRELGIKKVWSSKKDELIDMIMNIVQQSSQTLQTSQARTQSRSSPARQLIQPDATPMSAVTEILNHPPSCEAQPTSSDDVLSPDSEATQPSHIPHTVNETSTIDPQETLIENGSRQPPAGDTQQLTTDDTHPSLPTHHQDMSDQERNQLQNIYDDIKLIKSKLEIKDSEIELLNAEVKTAYCTIHLLQQRIADLEHENKSRPQDAASNATASTECLLLGDTNTQRVLRSDLGDKCIVKTIAHANIDLHSQTSTAAHSPARNVNIAKNTATLLRSHSQTSTAAHSPARNVNIAKNTATLLRCSSK